MKSELNLPPIYELNTLTFWESKELYRVIGYATSEYALSHPAVQQLLHGAKDRHYDLILTEQYYQDAFLMFAQQFRAPIISICMLI